MDLVVEYHAMELGTGHIDIDTTAGALEPLVTPAPAASPGTPVAGTQVMSPAAPTPPPVTLASATTWLPQLEFVSPPPNVEEYLDAGNDDDVESRYRTIDNNLRAASPPGLIARQVAAELYL